MRLIRLISPFKNGRKFAEKLLLFGAFAAAFTLCWLHTSFVNNPPTTQTNCLFLALNHSNLNHGNLADYDVIRLHITTATDNHLRNETTVNHRGSSKESFEECRVEEAYTDAATTADTNSTDLSKHVYVSQPWIYLFSLEKGYLMLARPDQRDRHGIRRLDITIPRYIHPLIHLSQYIF